LTSSSDHTAVLWDVGTAKQRFTIHHDGAVIGASFSMDENAILTWSDDGTIGLSDSRSGLKQTGFKGSTAVRHALYSRDRVLAWFADGTLRLWNAKSGALILQHAGCGDQIEGLFSADGRYALIRCSDGTLQTLDSDTGAELGRMIHEHAQGAAFSPDGNRLLSWAPDGTVRVWDIHGKKMGADIVHSSGVSGAAFSPLGERVVTWGGDNAARIWALDTGRQFSTLNHTKWVAGAVFTENGKRVWTWSADGSARMWDAATGKELRRLQHGDAIVEANLLAGERMLATRSGRNGTGRNLRLWDAQTGELLVSLTVGATRIANDGRYLATWADDPSVQLWPLWAPMTTLVDQASKVAARLRPLSPLAQCQAHLTDAVGCDQFPAATEKLLAVIGEDKHLRLSLHPLDARKDSPSMGGISADVKVQLVVNDRSEAFVFHNKPFRKTLKRLEFNPSTLRLIFRMSDGDARDFGLSVDARLGRYFDYTQRVLVVLMDEKTGQPIEGTYYPLLLY
jgi:WD40 repeat protein